VDPRGINHNAWGVIAQDEKILELRWLPSTATMTDGAFMATLCLFAWEAEKLRPQGLLIDAIAFQHRFANAAGVMAWRNAHVIPRYGAAGVQRLAFLMPPGAREAGQEAVEGPAIFPTAWFVTRQEALTWLHAAIS